MQFGFRPGVIFFLDRQRDSGGRIARIEIDLPLPLGRIRQKLHHQPAGPPIRAGAGHAFGDGETHPRRDLFGLAEILMRRFLPALAFEGNHALVARHLITRVDREGEMAFAQKLGFRN